MSRRLLLLVLLAAPAAAGDLLVITPDSYRPALAEWRKHREAQGLTIEVRAPEKDMVALVRRAHEESGGKLRFVLLLGDVRTVPCTYEKADVIRIWERDTRIATDQHISDLDGDELPDLAVGRLPADNLAEAKRMLDKVVAYERNADFSTWRRRVNVIAGVAGFGKLQDWLIEQVSTKFLRDNVPPGYELHVTYANPDSPFCPPPARVADTVLERFNEGALLVAYMGHGSRTRLDRLRYRDRSYEIFDEDSAYRLAARRGAPIAYFCACSTGHMDGAPDSLAEVALKQAKGPVAIFAASRVSIPYANGVLSKELLDALFKLRVDTVGEMLMQAKRRMMKPEKGDKMRQAIDMLARPWKWKPEDQEAERREHLYLYNLFGDPATRIPHPEAVELECAEEAAPGGRLKVKGMSAVVGDVLVELVAERTPDVPPRDGDTPAAFAIAYERANAWVKSSARAQTRDGAFSVEVPLPAKLEPGSYHVRVYVTGADGAALGARPLVIRKP